MQDIKNQVIGAYNNWVRVLREARVPEKFWFADRDCIKSAIHGNADAIDDMFNKPHVWTKGHFVLIDGVAGSPTKPPHEVRTNLAYVLLVSAVSYFVTRDEGVSGRMPLKIVDFGRFQTHLNTSSKDEAGRHEFDSYCNAEILFVYEMQRLRSNSYSDFYSNRIDEVIRSRKDAQLSTIFSFTHGCTQALKDGTLGMEMGSLLDPVHASATSYNADKKIYRISTKPMGVSGGGNIEPAKNTQADTEVNNA